MTRGFERRRAQGRVALVVRPGSAIGRATAERLAGEGALVHHAEEEACRSGAAIAECIDGSGRLDATVIAPPDMVIEPFPRASLRDHRSAIDAALRAAFVIVQHAVRAMGEGGRICVAAPRRPEGIASDAAAPAMMVEGGLVAMVRLLAVELAPAGIAVNGVCPVDAQAEPASVAAALAFLASPDASYITGASIPILR